VAGRLEPSYTDAMSEAPSCPGCQALLLEIQRLQQRIAALETTLARNSSNSSTPPSANPPSAPAPSPKKRSGRKRGGQPGHKGHRRSRLPAGRVSSVVAFVPKACAACSAPLPAEARPGDPEPDWHQVLELPEQPVAVTEHQGHARLCPCGAVTREPIPAAIRAEAFGPRLSASFSLLASWQHVSVRGLQDVALAMLESPALPETLGRLQDQMGQALAAPCEALAREVADAPVKQVDETGWKKAAAARAGRAGRGRALLRRSLEASVRPDLRLLAGGRGGDRARRDGRQVHARAEAGGDAVDVRTQGGRGADEQRGGAGAAPCGGEEEEELQHPERRGRGVAGADAERDGHAPQSRAGRPRLPRRGAARLPQRLSRPAHPCWPMNDHRLTR
jgi:hypothetical protein